MDQLPQGHQDGFDFMAGDGHFPPSISPVPFPGYEFPVAGMTIGYAFGSGESAFGPGGAMAVAEAPLIAPKASPPTRSPRAPRSPHVSKSLATATTLSMGSSDPSVVGGEADGEAAGHAGDESDDGAPKSGGSIMCPFPGCGRSFNHAVNKTLHIRRRHTFDKPHRCDFPGCNKVCTSVNPRVGGNGGLPSPGGRCRARVGVSPVWMWLK